MNQKPTTPEERLAARELAAARIVARNPKMKQAVEEYWFLLDGRFAKCSAWGACG